MSKIHFNWYDHWLKGGPATSSHQSGVLIFLISVNEWRAEAEWHFARAVQTPLYLAPYSSLTGKRQYRKAVSPVTPTTRPIR